MQIDLKNPRLSERCDAAVCRRFLLSLPLIFLVASAPLAHAARHHPHGSKLAVRKITHLEDKWQAAQLNSNVAAMASMLADDYVGISPDGTLSSKSETLASLKNGALHFTSITLSERKIRVYGGTAVVISKAEVAGTHGGNEISGTYRYTRVYHLDGANWKIVSFEVSKIPDGAKLADAHDKRLKD